MEITKITHGCIYCNEQISEGAVCLFCRGTRTNHRKGHGGYPAYDSGAKGSNNLKYSSTYYYSDSSSKCYW